MALHDPLPRLHPVQWGKIFLAPHCHDESPPFHWILADLIFGKSRKVALAAPRGHAKSTLTDLVCLLYGAAHQEFRYCLIVSDTLAQAKLFLEEIRRECEQNEALLDVYPGLAEGEIWRDDDIVFANGVRVQAVGTGMKLRGRKHRGTRPDMVLCDDIENDEQVTVLERRKKLRKWFRAALIPAMAPTGRIRVIGTILHRDSLLARLIRNESWTRRKWRALSDNGRALWEARRPAAVLLAEKEEYRKDGQLADWYQEFQNEAIATEESAFRPEDILYFNELPRDPSGKLTPFYKSLFVDPAIGEKERSDFTAYTVVYATHDGFWFVMEAFRRRDDPAKIIETVKKLHRKHQLDTIGIESVQYQKALAFFLSDQEEESGEYLPIEEIVPDQDKRRRILALQPYYRKGRIKHHEKLNSRLEEELLNLDSLDHDDLADSLAGHLFITLRPEPPKIRRKKFKDASSERAYRHRQEMSRQARLKRRGISEFGGDD